MSNKSPLFALLASFLTLSLVSGPARSGGTDYLLGAQDKIRVKTYEWHEANGDFNDWPALSGEYTISERGQIIMPVVGEIPAAGHSAADVANLIADRLKTRMTMDEKPNVIVDVVAFRPIYVVGAVARPGEYAYREGMTLLHVVSISGGLQQATGGTQWQTTKDLISFRGEFSQLAQNLARLKARRARLEAEVQHRDAIAFPAELKDNPSEQIAAILKEEQAVFDGRREADKQLVANADSQKALVKSKIDVMQKRIDVLAKQEKSADDALKRLRRLLSRGYLNTIRRLALERNVVDVQSLQLEYKTRMVMAEQEIAASEKELLNTQLNAQAENIAALQDAIAKIDEAVQRSNTLQALIHEAEAASPAFAGAGPAASGHGSLRFVIRRGTEVVDANNVDTPVVPGDVITIEQGSPMTEGKVTVLQEFNAAAGVAPASR